MVESAKEQTGVEWPAGEGKNRGFSRLKKALAGGGKRSDNEGNLQSSPATANPPVL